MNQIITIPGKNRVIVFTLFLVAIFTMGSVWTVIQPPNRKWYHQHPKFWMWIAIVLSIIECIACLFFIKLLIQNRSALIIDDIGIKGSSISFSGEYVYWNNIERFEIVNTPFHKGIIVFIDAPKAYIFKEQNNKNRKQMELFFKQYGSPVFLQSADIKYDLEELCMVLSRYQQEK